MSVRLQTSSPLSKSIAYVPPVAITKTLRSAITGVPGGKPAIVNDHFCSSEPALSTESVVSSGLKYQFFSS